MQTFMEALGYTFRDPALLQRALTHPSMGAEDNQRLEFLGDAVLQYVMSDLLFRKHPQEQEGGLTHQRALLVCEAALAQVARKLGVGHVLRMDKGEELTGGRDKPSVLAMPWRPSWRRCTWTAAWKRPGAWCSFTGPKRRRYSVHAGQQGRAPGVSPAGWRRGAHLPHHWAGWSPP